MSFYNEIRYNGPICEIDKDFKHSEENLKRNTDKKYLQEEFYSMTKDMGDICRQDDILLEYKPLVKDTSLKPENLIDITTLTKSVDKLLVGKCLLGRCITNPIKLAAIAFLMEDPNGHRAVRVAIYNSSLPVSSFSIGTIVTILSPYFRSLRDGNLALRSYNANYVIILSKEEAESRFPLVKWQEERHEPSPNREISLDDKVLRYRKEGNEHFSIRCYVAAIECYEKGLSLSPNDEDLLSNRCLCYLRSGKFIEALNDAFRVLKNNPTHVKAIHRAASAYVGLKQYDVAKDFLKNKLELNISKDDVQNLLEKTEEFIAQRDDGKYDMIKLYASLGEDVVHEIEDYVVPVEIADVGEKGRGLRAKKDMEPGELLICCQAFAVHYRDSIPPLNVPQQSMLPLDELHEMVANKIARDPDAAKEFYQLTAGETLEPYYKTRDCYGEDMTRIEMVVANNVIESHEPRKKIGYGIWILPSYINNDCIDVNCTLVIFGNVCQVRCVKKMKKGEELLRSYTDHGVTKLHRAFKFEMQQQFTCKCRLCSVNCQSLKIELKRDKLVNEFLQNEIRDPMTLKRVVKEMVELDPNFPFNNYYIAKLVFETGNLELEKNQFSEAISSYIHFLKISSSKQCGGDLVKYQHRVSANLFLIYIMRRDYVNAMKYYNILISEHFKLYLGQCSPELLEAVHPGMQRAVYLLQGATADK